jgi:hypothetical protein
MTRAALLILVVAVTVTMHSTLHAQAPQPSAEAKRLAAFVGTFEYEGASVNSPVGPAGKMAGRMTGRMLTGGSALELSGGDSSGPFGGVQWSEIHAWDSAGKVYRVMGHQTDGQIWYGWSSVSGNVWRFTMTWVIKGVAYHSRVEHAWSADGRSYDWKSEVSTDGKTWVPFAQQKGKKVSQ